MDLIRLVGCGIGIFSIILVLYFMLYYYPLPFYYEHKLKYPLVASDLRDFRNRADRFRLGFWHGKVPVAERLHKVQKERILGKKPLDDRLYTTHNKNVLVEEWWVERKGQGDRLRGSKTPDANLLQGLKRKDLERLLELNKPDVERFLGIKILNAQDLHTIKRIAADILRGMKNEDSGRSDWQEAKLEMQASDTNRLNAEKKKQFLKEWQENLRERQKVSLRTKDSGTMHDRLVAARKDRLQSMRDGDFKIEYDKQLPTLGTPEVPSRSVQKGSLRTKDSGTMHERLLAARKDRLKSMQEGLEIEYDKQVPTLGIPEVPSRSMQKVSLRTKDSESMRERLLAARKDRLQSNQEGDLEIEYDKQVPTLGTPEVPSRSMQKVSLRTKDSGTMHERLLAARKDRLQSKQEGDLEIEYDKQVPTLGSLEVPSRSMQKVSLRTKDSGTMRERLLAARKDRLQSMQEGDLENEYDEQQLLTLGTSEVPSRSVPVEVFHGLEQMLGR